MFIPEILGPAGGLLQQFLFVTDRWTNRQKIIEGNMMT